MLVDFQTNKASKKKDGIEKTKPGSGYIDWLSCVWLRALVVNRITRTEADAKSIFVPTIEKVYKHFDRFDAKAVFNPMFFRDE